MTKTPIAFLTGCDGQDGSYMAELLLSKGYIVHGLIRRSVNNPANIANIRHKLILHYGDLETENHISRIIADVQPDLIFNLAGQSDVMASFEIPEYTGNITGLGVTRVLEAVRHFSPNSRVYQASSSEMFGGFPPPQNEETPLRARSPYACAKIFAHNFVRNYRESYGLFCCSGIAFNHETMAEFMPVFVRKDGSTGFDIMPLSDAVPQIDQTMEYYQECSINNLSIWGSNGWVRVKHASAYPHQLSTANKAPRMINGRCGAYMATGSHVAFLDGEEKATKDIVLGNKFDIVALPIRFTSTSVVSLEEAELIGMMVADGSITRAREGIGISSKFTKNSKLLLDRFTYLWNKITGGRVVARQNPSGFAVGHFVTQLSLVGGSDWLRSLDLYTHNKKKRIPRKILNAPDDVQLAFLDGYNRCDGLKINRCVYQYKSWKTNSATLAAGLWYLADKLLPTQNKNITVEYDQRCVFYYSINLSSTHENTHAHGSAGSHLIKPFAEIKKIIEQPNYTGWFYDLETESGEFVSGIGNIHVHNSERRPVAFVTRKITNAVARIKLGKQHKLELGNLEGSRDWGYAPDYVKGMLMMLECDKPDDFVLGTGVGHTVRDFAKAAFDCVGLDYKQYVVVNPKYVRPSETYPLLANPAKANTVLGWKAETTFEQLVEKMVNNDLDLEGGKL